MLNQPYQIQFFHFIHDKESIADMARELIQYSPAVLNGMDRERCLGLVLEQLQCESVYAAKTPTGKTLGAISFIPKYFQYPHLYGKVLHTNNILVRHPRVCQELLRTLCRNAKGWGVDWVTVMRPVSDTEVRMRYLKL